MSIITYAVNCNDAWLNTEGDDISGSYVKYKDHQEVVAELQAKCAALADEVEAVKSAHQDAVDTIMYTANRTGVLYTEKTIQMSCKTPATDAFLAEVRAQGVEQLASLAGNECHRYKSVGDRAGAIKWKSIVILCTDFAAQLRQEASQ